MAELPDRHFHVARTVEQLDLIEAVEDVELLLVLESCIDHGQQAKNQRHDAVATIGFGKGQRCHRPLALAIEFRPTAELTLTQALNRRLAAGCATLLPLLWI